MVCRRCGRILEDGVRSCPFCGEPAAGANETMAKRHDGLPEWTELHALAAVPEEKDQLLSELRRLYAYFLQVRGKYGVCHDLWLMQWKEQEPSLLRWTVGSGVLTAVVYLIFWGILPGMARSFFFVLWGGMASIGYIRSGRRYERRRSRLAADLRRVENELRDWYNQAENCFLPLDYSDPKVIRELIAGMESGRIHSFREYRINGEA